MKSQRSALKSSWPSRIGDFTELHGVEVTITAASSAIYVNPRRPVARLDMIPPAVFLTLTRAKSSKE